MAGTIVILSKSDPMYSERSLLLGQPLSSSDTLAHQLSTITISDHGGTPSEAERLPLEVTERIIDFLADMEMARANEEGEAQLDTVRACRATCRAWSTRANYHLHHRLLIRVFEQSPTEKYADHLDRIGALVNELRITSLPSLSSANPEAPPPSRPTVVKRLEDVLATALPRIPHIKALTLTLPTLRDLHEPAELPLTETVFVWFSPSNFPSLHSLSLTSMTLSLRDLARLLHSFRASRLQSVKLWKLGIDEASMVDILSSVQAVALEFPLEGNIKSFELLSLTHSMWSDGFSPTLQVWLASFPQAFNLERATIHDNMHPMVFSTLFSASGTSLRFLHLLLYDGHHCRSLDSFTSLEELTLSLVCGGLNTVPLDATLIHLSTIISPRIRRISLDFTSMRSRLSTTSWKTWDWTTLDTLLAGPTFTSLESLRFRLEHRFPPSPRDQCGVEFYRSTDEGCEDKAKCEALLLEGLPQAYQRGIIDALTFIILIGDARISRYRAESIEV